MEFEKVLEFRQSIRKYSDKKVGVEQIEAILSAANHAPIGSNLYKDVHITIVQNQEILLKLCDAAWHRFSKKEQVKEIAGDVVTDEEAEMKKPHLFYDAPVVFFVSHRKQKLQPGIEWANVTSVVNQMHLEATNLGLGSVYMWGALESMRMLPEYDHTDLLDLPEDYEPLIALAVGYSEIEMGSNEKNHEKFQVNYIK